MVSLLGVEHRVAEPDQRLACRVLARDLGPIRLAAQAPCRERMPSIASLPRRYACSCEGRGRQGADRVRRPGVQCQHEAQTIGRAAYDSVGRGHALSPHSALLAGAGVDRSQLAQALPRLADTADELKAVSEPGQRLRELAAIDARPLPIVGVEARDHGPRLCRMLRSNGLRFGVGTEHRVAEPDQRLACRVLAREHA